LLSGVLWGCFLGWPRRWRLRFLTGVRLPQGTVTSVDLELFSSSLLCPVCGHLNQAGLHPDGGPAPGDVAVCMMCRVPSVYHATAFGLSLRLLSDQEREKVMASEPVKALLRVLDQYDAAVAAGEA
jgi:hypothetical protein